MSEPAANPPLTARGDRRPSGRRLPWPAPALATWLLAWALLSLLLPLSDRLQTPAALPWLLATAAGAALALLLREASGWRRLFMAAGFPVSAVLSGAAAAMPPWAWLLPLALLLAAYPLRAWRDAPLFPTPAGAMLGLADRLPLADGVSVLDAGCGLGHGLAALRQAWPTARVEGIEWSWPLRLAAALRCPWARVRQGDMWSADWSGHGLVYLFQRPESMARAWAKACAEMAPGSWMLSLEFAVPAREPDLRVALAAGRELLAWRIPAQPAEAGADNPH